MKMHDIIVKQGLAIIVTFYYICLFKNLVITILKVVGCEDCVREQVTTKGAWAILAICFGKEQQF